MLKTGHQARTHCIIASIASYVLIHVVVAQEATVGVEQIQAPQTFSITVPNFSQVAPQDAEKLADQIEEQQDSITYLMLTQLREGGLSIPAKSAIIGYLGSLRVTDAIPDLVKEINFNDRVGVAPAAAPATAPPRFHGYMARQCLKVIGGDASKYILDLIGSRTTENEEEGGFKLSQVDGMVDVLYGIEGKEWAILKLQARMKRAKTPEAKSHYQLVIDRFNQAITKFH